MMTVTWEWLLQLLYYIIVTYYSSVHDLIFKDQGFHCYLLNPENIYPQNFIIKFLIIDNLSNLINFWSSVALL